VGKVGVFAVLVAVASAAAFFVPEPSAGKPLLVNGGGKPIRGKWARWLRASQMPVVGGRIRIIFGSCPSRPEFAGCVHTHRPRTVYLRPDAQSPSGVLYHELGHSFDLLVLRHAQRRTFKRIMRLAGRGWFTGAGAPAELFAEGYALCSRFGIRRPAADKLNFTKSVYGYRPTRRQHRSICKLILRAGAVKRHGHRPRPQPPADAPPVTEQKPPQRPSEQPGSAPAPLLPIPGLPLP
jgi:hypothetical protein